MLHFKFGRTPLLFGPLLPKPCTSTSQAGTTCLPPISSSLSSPSAYCEITHRFRSRRKRGSLRPSWHFSLTRRTRLSLRRGISAPRGERPYEKGAAPRREADGRFQH